MTRLSCTFGGRGAWRHTKLRRKAPLRNASHEMFHTFANETCHIGHASCHRNMHVPIKPGLASNMRGLSRPVAASQVQNVPLRLKLPLGLQMSLCNHGLSCCKTAGGKRNCLGARLRCQLNCTMEAIPDIVSRGFFLQKHHQRPGWFPKTTKHLVFYGGQTKVVLLDRTHLFP